METIGLRIKKLRELQKLTQEHMAENMKMSVSGYGKIERDEIDIPLSRLKEIAASLKIKVKDLLDDEATITVVSTMNNNTEKGNNNGIVFVNGISENEQKLWQEQVAAIKEENKYLKEMIDFLKSKFS
jgi:transcriptional regulator with XRE-family HTH domain